MENLKININNLPSLKMEFIPQSKIGLTSNILESLGMKFSWRYNNEPGFSDVTAWAKGKQYEPYNEILVTVSDLEALAQKAQGEGLNSFEAMIGEQPTQAENLADRHNETNPVLFVYQKDGTTKALSFKEAKEDAAELINAGWAHVATLDAKVFVEHHYGQESKAQRRYEVAMQYLDGMEPECNTYTVESVVSAVRIAAGLEAS